MPKTHNPELEEQRRSQLMMATARLLAEGSGREVTLDRVAREAGVSKGMLTYYFASKGELLAATVRHFFELQEQAVVAIVDDDSSTVEQRLDLLVSWALPEPGALAVELGFLVAVWAEAKRDPELLDALRQTRVRLRRHGERLVAKAAAKGQLSAQDHRWLTLVMMALLDGLSIQLAIDEELDGAEIRTKLARLFADLLADRR